MPRDKLLRVLPIIFIAALVFAIPTFAGTKTSENLLVSEVQTENYYGSGEKISIEAKAEKDLLLAGGQVEVKEAVGENLFLAGSHIQVDGNVGGDISVAGAYVIINGDVDGDLRVAGAEVYINSGVINGDLMAVGSKIQVAENLEITGTMSLTGNETVTNVEPTVSTLADLPAYEQFNFNLAEAENMDFGPTLAAIAAVGVFVSFLVWFGNYLAGYLVIRLFPVYTEKTLNTMRQRAAISVAVGFLTLLLAALVAVILLVSVVGVPVLGTLLLLGVLAVIFANVYSSYLVGRLSLQKLGYDKTGRALALFVGYLIVGLLGWLLSIIPIIGFIFSGLLSLVLTSWGLGSIVTNKYESLNSSKKK